jgi:hypothetical protein
MNKRIVISLIVLAVLVFSTASVAFARGTSPQSGRIADVVVTKACTTPTHYPTRTPTNPPPTNTPTNPPPTKPPPTNTPTVPPPTNTPTEPPPTSTPTTPPTSTPTNPPPTNTPTEPPPTSTPIPTEEICIPDYIPTGETIFQYTSIDSGRIHYGFLRDDGVYMGVCSIHVFDGGVPLVQTVIDLCECQLPADYIFTHVRVDKYMVVKNSCTGDEELQKVNTTYNFFGQWKTDKFCSVTDCPPRPR